MTAHIFADPWRLQLAMLPIRREYPDDKRNGKLTRAQAATAYRIKLAASKQGVANRERIAAALSGARRMAVKDVMAAVRLTRDTVEKHLTDLERLGMAKSVKKGRERLWSPTARPRD